MKKSVLVYVFISIFYPSKIFAITHVDLSSLIRNLTVVQEQVVRVIALENNQNPEEVLTELKTKKKKRLVHDSPCQMSESHSCERVLNRQKSKYRCIYDLIDQHIKQIETARLYAPILAGLKQPSYSFLYDFHPRFLGRLRPFLGINNSEILFRYLSLEDQYGPCAAW